VPYTPAEAHWATGIDVPVLAKRWHSVASEMSAESLVQRQFPEVGYVGCAQQNDFVPAAVDVTLSFVQLKTSFCG
jgi:hypothetical protein